MAGPALKLKTLRAIACFRARIGILQDLVHMLVHRTAYQFRELRDLSVWKARLLELAANHKIKGMVIIAKEGINFSVIGEPSALDLFLTFLRDEMKMDDLFVQESPTDERAFRRFCVKIRKEIVTFGTSIEIGNAEYIEPAELSQRLAQSNDLVLLDVRKRMEFEHGSFETAQKLDMNHFREFPRLAEEFPEEWRDREIVTFCTGGVRCEKAARYLTQKGFKRVRQLKGGILNYLKSQGNEHWRGECFVFDHRVYLPNLKSSAQDG